MDRVGTQRPKSDQSPSSIGPFVQPDHEKGSMSTSRIDEKPRIEVTITEAHTKPMRITLGHIIQVLQLWRWEMFMWSLGSAGFISTIAILAHYHHTPQSTWRFEVQITTVVAALAQLSQSAFLVPISSSISQWKWKWFQTERPAIDFDKFDTASRGPDGSLRLLYHLKSQPHIVSLGALSTILLLAFPSFIQQSVAIKVRQFALPGDGHTYLDRSRNWDTLWTTNGQERESFAVIRSMLNEYLDPANVTGSCPTGRCTWNDYQTLAACAEAEELTISSQPTPEIPHEIQGSSGVNSTTFYATASAVRYDLGSYHANDTELQVLDIANVYMSFYDPCIELQSHGTTFADIGNPRYWRMFKGTMRACVQTLNSNFDSFWHSSIVSSTERLQWGKAVLLDTESKDYFCTTVGSEEFCVARDLSTLLGKTLQRAYNITAAETRGDDDKPLGTSSQWSSVIMNDVRDYEMGICSRQPMTGFSNRIQRLATSMSLEMRSGMDRVYGTALKSDQMIEVTFIWLSAPIVLYICITIFFFATVCCTRKSPPWKSSTLALLQSADRKNGIATARDLRRYGKSTYLSLKHGDDAYKLVETRRKNNCRECDRRRGDPCSECRWT